MVSIVIPIFNPGDKLLVCLNSIKQQTYHDIEVIMVNDGSQDSSDVLCKEFANKDPRFNYIEQVNSGVSVARNNGIMHSHGEYICFIDSDDSVKQDYVECMVVVQQRTKADIVVQGLTNIYNGKKGDKKEFPDLTLDVNSLGDQMFDELFYFCGPYCKLFKREYIINNHIEFPEDLAYGEDFVFYAKYLHLCNSVAFISKSSYNYSVAVKGSLSSKRLHPDKFWENQLNRRREYVALRKEYGILRDFYPSENINKLIALRGLLSSVKEYGLDMRVYLHMIKSDIDFGFADIHPRNLKDKFILLLINKNTFLSRVLLKIVVR